MKSVAKLLTDKPQSNVWSVGPETLVIDALLLMNEKKIGAVVVLEGEDLVGIFSERDYARKGIVQGRSAKSTSIKEVMTPKVFTVDKTMNINECMQIFSEKKFRHLPVVENKKVIGILSIGDIVNSIINDQKDHIDFLEQYIRN
ncbi:MAG: CBS domain-containing protein [Bacteroidota bacterium]